MYLSDIQRKEIVDINYGKKVGQIIDVMVDRNGQIKNLLLESKREKRFSGKDEYEIKWSQIIKIGDDIILVDSNKNIL